MKDFIKVWLNRISPPPENAPPEIREAEQMNIEHDNKKLDESIAELEKTTDYFSSLVKDVVDGVRRERRERSRRGQKTH